jgi:excisionase family DNA binding protein
MSTAEAIKSHDQSNTVRTIAKRLGVSERQAWRYIAEGRLKAERYSRRIVRVRDSELERFRNACAYGGER